MKLYTLAEEQVKDLIWKDSVGIKPTIKHFLDLLTPIELPSDEEIKEHFSWGYGGDSGSAIYGAKWMKEQILNQNNK